MIPVKMPVVGQDIPTGIIKEWLKKEGDAVSIEEIIATVESEKATFDVEAPASGIILKILWMEDEEVKVLSPIAYIGQVGEKFEDAQEFKATPQRTISDKSEKDTAKGHLSAPDNSSRIFASPLAKKIAKLEGIELESVKGSGPGGRIMKRNVLDTLKVIANQDSQAKLTIPPSVNQMENNPALSEGEKEVPFDRLRQLIANKLTLSKQSIPHFYLVMNVEMNKAIAIKEGLRMRNIRVTITDLVIHTVAKAMSEFPRINSHVFKNRYILLRDINIGLAVSSDDGLRVPVITHADKSDLSELAGRTKELSENAKHGRIVPTLKAGLTISTLGMYGISQFSPIINPPECAILAIGESSPKVLTDGTSISIKEIMSITLACDHRLIDGTYAAQFLGRVKEILETADFKTIKW